jgi:hypothetical protein
MCFLINSYLHLILLIFYNQCPDMEAKQGLLGGGKVRLCRQRAESS